MPRFQFSLHRLLDLRQLELQQLEMCASAEAQMSAAARHQAEQLVSQLSTMAGDSVSDQWLVLHQGAEAIRRQASEFNELADEHQQNHQALLAACAQKRIEVEALETLQSSERQEFQRRQARREEAAVQEQILRKWQKQDRQKSQPSQSAPPNGTDHLGRLNHG